MDHSHDRYLTPDEEFQIARRVWDDDRDARHAAHHLAAAVAGDPLDAQRLALLDEMIAGVGADPGADPAEVIAPLAAGEGGTYSGLVALRAHVLARTGRLAAAVDLIGQVHHVCPEIPYLEWPVRWLEEDPGAAAGLDDRSLASFFGVLLQRYPGNVIDAPDAREELQAALRFHERAVTRHGEGRMLTYGKVAILRKLGRFGEAEALARRTYDEEPDYFFATALGLICLSRDDVEGWLAWQKQALELDPTDTAVRRDLADWHLGQREFAEAAEYYRQAVELDPEDAWSAPSLHYARHQLDGDPESMLRLQEYAAGHPDNDRARSLLGADLPYATFLPPPSEAIVNFLPGFIDRHRADPAGAPGGSLSLQVSALEAPSARLAVEVQFRALGVEPDLTFGCDEVQSPDPRLPRGEVRYLAWRYREAGGERTTDPLPALPEPPARVSAAVARLAYRWYDRAQWYTAAGELMAGLDGVRAEQLVAAMVHPPEMPPDGFAPEWIQRCQVAAALMVAHLDPVISWEDSLRRRVLLDLARGPMDWTVTAAVVALTEVAQREPGAGPEAQELFLELLNGLPRPGAVCYEHPAVCCIQQLPCLPEGARQEFAAYQEAMERPAEEDAGGG